MRNTIFIILLSVVTITGQIKDTDLKLTTVTPGLVTVSCDRVETNTIALNTNEGIIIIDTQTSPDHAVVVRKRLLDHFGNGIIKYVINTHHHYDHVQGNQVFNDAVIIAHKNCPESMLLAAENTALIENPDINVESGDTSTIPPPPPPMTMNNNTPGYSLTLPDITFDRQLMLSSDEHSLHLFYYGPAHTDNDILIVIPDENALVTGDLFFKSRLPHFGNFKAPDVYAWSDLVDSIFEMYPDIQYVVPGHGDFMTVDEFRVCFSYLTGLYEEVGKLLHAGRSDHEIMEALALEKFAPELEELNVSSSEGGSIHNGNINRAIDIHKRNAAQPEL